MKICRSVLIALSVQLAFLLSSAATAFSQVRGVYSPGSTLTGAGTVASPSSSYSNQLWYGASSVLKGSPGNSLPLEVSLSLWIDNNTLAFVPKFKLLGANPEFTVDIAFSNDRLFWPYPAFWWLEWTRACCRPDQHELCPFRFGLAFRTCRSSDGL